MSSHRLLYIDIGPTAHTRRSLVAYTSLIWYGYKEAVDKARPKPDNPEVKIKELLRKMYPERPDMWVSDGSTAAPMNDPG